MPTRKRTYRTAVPILALLLAGAVPASFAETRPLDQPLKQRLAESLTRQGGFDDRYAAEVWLTDMSQRFGRKLPNRERRLQLLRLVHREARLADLAPELVLAVIEVESNFDRFAISEAGAQGLMQIMPFWLKEIGQGERSLFSIETNLRMGCTILRYYLDMEEGDLARALARYNGSLGSARYPSRVFRQLRSRWRR